MRAGYVPDDLSLGVHVDGGPASVQKLVHGHLKQNVIVVGHRSGPGCWTARPEDPGVVIVLSPLSPAASVVAVPPIDEEGYRREYRPEYDHWERYPG